ncbi:Ferrichrome-iron receptor [Nitrospira sp. KM1]|uniref:TonB-dependent siderophore receptor n=1 Tax=Nitrospira sp. KM1 TaxID=1936990 RepID=UPI0013A71BF7|nr:TonB-dependent receptor [Nitrospira sp. KM1]BCA56561.1 Ferrichrome-iron receptor [Nitrospira sp. KM1]
MIFKVRSKIRGAMVAGLLVGELGSIAYGASPTQPVQSDQTFAFEIPSQPLPSALDAFIKVTNWQVGYGSDLAQGVVSPGVTGQYPPGEALTRILDGTGLTYRSINGDTVTLERTNTSAASAAAAVGVGAMAAAEGMSSGGAGSQSKPVKVPEIFVKDVRERENDTKSYVAEEASTATRTDTPIRDVPQSIQVITRKVIEEQRTFRLADSLQNIAGIVTDRNTQGLNDAFLIRGFSVTNIYRNGLIDPSNINNATDNYNVQRLEVLKGPASVLYGQGDPGGIVNLVTKKPLADPYYSANVMIGSYNFYRTELDATGPLNASKTVLYRINFAGQKAESFVDYVKRDLIAVSPAITWLIGAKTTLTVEADYLKRQNPDYGGLPALGTVLPNINGALPRNRNTTLGEKERYERTQTRVGYDLTHQFNNDWAIRNAYRYTIFEENQLLSAFPTGLLPDQRTLTRAGIEGGSTGSIWHRHFHNMFTNVTGHFPLLGMDHRLLMGFELRQDKTDPTQGVFRTAPNLDLFAPSYGQGLGEQTFAFFSKSDSKMAGAYLQDLIELLPNLKFLGGVRFDYVHQSINPTPSSQLTSDDTAVSPRLGLVYQPIEPVSLYTSWTRGFLPNTADTLNPSGQLFKPERSTQYEVGIKTFFLDNRVSTTLAWYHLTRENLLTPDPTLGPLGYSLQTGEQRSQGIELDVTASLTSGWNVIASYAYTDAEVTKDNDPSLLHKRLGFVPYNKATLWSTYYFQEGLLQGFGVGGGVFGYTSRNASIFGPELNIPGFVRVDAALYYNHNLPVENWLHAKQVNLAVNFRNLFDQGYIESAFNSTTRLFYGEPRTVLATLGLKF